MFGPQKVVSKNIVPNEYWLQVTLGQSLFKIQLVVAEIYHYNETKTNVG